MWILLAAMVGSAATPCPPLGSQLSTPVLEKRCFEVKETGERITLMLEKGFTPSRVIRRKAVSGYRMNPDGTVTASTYAPALAEEHRTEVPCT